MYICKRAIVIDDKGFAPNQQMPDMPEERVRILLEEGWIQEVSASLFEGTLSVEEKEVAEEEPDEIAALDPERKPKRKR